VTSDFRADARAPCHRPRVRASEPEGRRLLFSLLWPVASHVVADAPSPGWLRGWCRDGQPSSRHPPRGCPVSQDTIRCRLFGNTGQDATTTDASCQLQRRPGIPAWSLQPRTDLSPATPKAEPPRPEAPCHRQVPGSLREGFRPRRVPPEPPPLPGFATVEEASSRLSRPTPGPLDLRQRGLFTLPLRPHAACRLLQLDVTRARPRLAQAPSPTRQAELGWDSPATMGRTGQVSSGQGSMQNSLRDPHRHDRSRLWIYPNLTDPSTSCHLSVPLIARKRR